MPPNGAVPSVAIFWDYENVQVPCDFPTSRVVDDLRRLALREGKLAAYRAYLDTDFARGPKGAAMRGALQTGGITVADTPHRNRKEVADVMIISDMLEFGLLTTLPVVILVTGDRGFSYPCKRLVDNRCKVILVTTDASSGYNSLKDSVDVVIDYRTELLRLPSRQRSYPRYSQEPAPIVSSSTSQSRASTSRMPVARVSSLPSTYEEVAPLRSTGAQDDTQKRSSTSRPIKPIPSTSSAKSKGKSKAVLPRPAPAPTPSKATETLTLSDDDDEEDEDDLVQQMLAPAVRSVSIISTDSVLASPSRTKLRNPSFAPAFPSTMSSNHLQPPVNRSRSRSRSADPVRKSSHRLPSPCPSDIQEEEEGAEEDFDSMLGGSQSARKGLGSSGKASSSKKRGLGQEVESAKKAKKKKRTSSASGTKQENQKESRSEDLDMFGSKNEVPILVISDDEED